MPVHHFDVDIAVEYGVNAALLLQNIAYWVYKNAETGRNLHDGEYWTYNSRKAFVETFPYMGERKIENALKRLIEGGLIKSGNYNRAAMDRTRWYTLTDRGKATVPNAFSPLDETSNALCQNVQCITPKSPMQEDETSNALCQNVQPIPNIKPYNKPNIKPDDKESKTRPRKKTESVGEKKPYGEFGNVFLSDAELEKLKQRFSDWDDKIERLSCAIDSKGYKYNSHYSTILNWARRDNEKKGEANPGPKTENRKANGFNSMENREWDFEEIEKQSRRNLYGGANANT